MEESSSSRHLKHDILQQLLLRVAAMRMSFAKLLTLSAVGLPAAVVWIRYAPKIVKADQNHTYEYRPSLRHFNGYSYGDMMLPRDLQDTALNCTVDCCGQFQEAICGGGEAWISAIPFGVQILLVVVLLALSALFSGLTLGIMSLDVTGLEIVMHGDDPKAAGYAKAIYPVRKNGNLLLCTLLLGNVSVNSLVSILMADYTSGVVGLLSSTFLILILGEIGPQAVCSRYPLRIGSASVPLVRVIVAIMYPVAKPLAYCLDRALGEELATTYSTAEMMKLLQIHVQQNVIDKETAGAMTGALTYKNIAVKEAMTPMDRTFMLSVDEKLSFETIAKIFKTGYSRIPVFEITKDNIIGLLFVKDLIFIDPEDEVPIRSFVQIFGRGVHVVWPDDKLGDVLTELKKGRTHLAVVRDVNNAGDEQDPFYEVKGIITLEDIIEKIIGDSIVDETDEYVDRTGDIKVQRDETFEWARLRLLDAKIVDDLLSPSEAKAVVAHFRINYPTTFELLTDTQLDRLVSNTPVVSLDTAKRELGKDFPDDLLYKKGTRSDTCTLILSGKVTIVVGDEDFRSDLSSWSVLGRSALEMAHFTPDFTAFVSDGPCRCLQITYSAFVSAVDASAIERTASEIKISHLKPPPSTIPDNSGNNSTDKPSAATASTKLPNRREKLLAKLLGKEGTDSPITAELDVDRDSIVRFDEDKKAHPGTVGKNDANALANDIEDTLTTTSTEKAGGQES